MLSDNLISPLLLDSYHFVNKETPREIQSVLNLISQTTDVSLFLVIIEENFKIVCFVVESYIILIYNIDCLK